MHVSRLTPTLATIAALTTTAAAQPGTQLFKLIPDEPSALVQFGRYVDLKGNLAAITGTGAFTLDVSARAYLFDAATGTQLAELDIPGDPIQATIGGDIAIGDGYVLYGRRINGGGPYSERVFVYSTTDPANPTRLTEFFPDGSVFSDAFGEAIDISGNLALIGAYGDNGLAGAAYLYDLTDPANPVELSKFTGDDSEGADTFGRAVALEGTTVLVGSRWDDDLGTRAGAAYLFDATDPTNPVQTAKLLASDGEEDDFFGFSVAISGDLAIVGAIFEDEAGFAAGAAYVFDISDLNDPFQTAKIIAPDASESDDLGWDVALEGTTALISARVAPGLIINTGAAYLYDLTDPANPAFITKLFADDGDGVEIFGDSIAISEGTALIGASADDTPADAGGSAYLFDISTGPTPCNDADFAEPLGKLDFFDVQLFLAAFASGSLDADLTGDGTLDFFDVQEFLSAFSDGCP